MKKFTLLLFALFLIYSSRAQQDYYWVGGTGNWDDYSNHWATTSGGSTFHSAPPTSADDVYFDANSFSATGQIVTLDVGGGDCRDMSWSGVTDLPTFTFNYVGTNQDFNIYGSLELSPNANYSIGNVSFRATTSGNTISSNGKSLNVNAAGVAASTTFLGTGEWTLQDPYETTFLYLSQGTLNTNNHSVTADRFTASGSGTKTLNLGSSEFELDWWDINCTNLTLDAGTSTISASTFYGDRNGDGPFTYYNLVLNGGSNLLSNTSTFNQITFQAGEETTLASGSTFTVGSLVAIGTKFSPITLDASTPGSEATFNSASGTVSGTYLVLTDIHATGGATFNADQSVDNGNNTGWNITPLSGSDYYWIGDGGNWTDPAHWATSSGGSTTYGDYPAELDDVFFDANSFTTGDQTVNVDLSAAKCNNMDWTGVTNLPTIFQDFPDKLFISGSATFNDGVEKEIFFMVMNSSNAGNTLTFGNSGLVVDLTFDGTGTWTLEDDIDGSRLKLDGGTLNLDDQAVTLSNDFELRANNTSTLNMGSGNLDIRALKISNPGNLTINPGTSVIKLTNNFDGEGFTFNDVIIDGTSNITGSNTFSSFTAMPGASLNLESGVTQTVNSDISLVGTRTSPISISSTSAGIQGTFSKSSGTVDAIYLVMQDIEATGGATFNATQTVDNGNNTGWTISAPVGVDYYWVGDGGNWTDFSNHWATTSGGETFHTDAPGLLDDVFFDQNSFTTDNQVVTLDVSSISLHDMDWSLLDRPAMLSGSTRTLNIYGSLDLSSNLTADIDNYIFQSDNTETLNVPISLGINSEISFQGTGTFGLQSDLMVKNFSVENGTFNSNGFNITATFEFNVSTDNVKVLDFGTSSISVRRLIDTSDNTTMNAGDATITISSVFNSFQGFGSNNIVYGDVHVIKNLSDQFDMANDLTVGNVTLDPGTTTVLRGNVLTVNSLTAIGTISDQITITNSGAGGNPGTISQASGTVDGDYLILENTIATGGAVFNAYNSLNNGNVSGWTFHKEDQTIDFTIITDKTLGDDPFSLEATATSGLEVSFSVISGPISLDGSIVTIEDAGIAKIQASQEGDISYNPAPSIIHEFTIFMDQSITFEELSSRIYGDDDFGLTAASSSGLVVSYESSDETVATVSGNMVTITGAGMTTITAYQAGDDTFNPATPVPQDLLISKAQQSITFDPLTPVNEGDADFDLSATASSGLAVSYSSSDETVAAVAGNNVTILSAGTTTITASQTGNGNFEAANPVAHVLTVAGSSKFEQTITFEALESKTFGDASFELVASATSELEISYASSDESVATISGNTVTIVGAGTTTITASQPGNDSFNPSANVSQELVVNRSGQTITFNQIPDFNLISDQPINLSATTTSGLEVSYEISGPAILDGNLLTPNAVGEVTVEAFQEGNENFLAAEVVTQSFDVVDAILGLPTSKTIHLIYPNPSKGFIQISGLPERSQVQIFDLSGVMVLKTYYDGRQISLTALQEGQYLLRSTTKEQSTFHRLVIMR